MREAYDFLEAPNRMHGTSLLDLRAALPTAGGIGQFPKAPGLPRNISAYMKRVEDAYVTDAYHSLSIEGIASPLS
jgi:hypothetical protein